MISSNVSWSYFIENPDEAVKIAEQVLINKRSRENAEKTRLNLKKKLAGSIDLANRVEKFVDCRSKDVNEREIYIVEGDSALVHVSWDVTHSFRRLFRSEVRSSTV